jgi:NitT/TauT family transport system substrate-binding protein
MEAGMNRGKIGAVSNISRLGRYDFLDQIKFFISTIVALIIATTSAAWAQPARAVRLSYAATAISNAPMWIASEFGLFKKNGLEVELTYNTSATTLTQAMIADEVQFAQMGIGPAILASLNSGRQFLALFATTSRVPYQLVTLKKVQDIKVFKGWGISRFGSSSDLILRLGLEQLGIVPEKDVVIVQVGSLPERVSALRAGAIDGTVVEAPASLIVAGLDVVRDLTAVDYPYFHSGLITTRKVIDSKRDVVEKVARGYAEAIRIFRTDQAKSLTVIEKFMRLKRNPPLLEGHEVFAQKLMDPVPRPTEEGILSVMKMLSKRNPEVMKLSPSSFIDSSFIEKLQKEGTSF